MTDTPLYISAPFNFSGQSFHALADRALFWPKHRALIVADLHFEKGSAFAGHGQHLPPYDSHDILQRLETLAKLTAAEQIFCLGDSFHDHHAASRMAYDVSDQLQRLASERRIMWIAGNHDGISGSAWGGEVADEWELDGIILRHESITEETRPEISGHYHPKLRLRVKGRIVSRPCFLISSDRILMPAFGSFTGGMNADHPEIAKLFSPSRYQARLMAGEQLLSFPIAATGPMTLGK